MALFDPQNPVSGAPVPPAPRFAPPPPPPPPKPGSRPAPVKPSEPEDIFANTTLGRGSNIPGTPETNASIAETPGRGLGRKLVRILFLAAGAAVIVGAGYLGYWYFTGGQNPFAPAANANLPLNANANANENANVNANLNANVPANLPFLENANANLNANLPPLAPADDPNSAVDTDGDGLTDYQEVRIYRTDELNSDTDGDGLTDYQEVLTWKTDSLNPDTDGDSYKDGEEVRNGYNPLGPGKLLPPVIR